MRVLLALLAGCALTSKSAPIEIEYFTPGLVAPSHARVDAPTGEAVRLRLGKVKASDHLRTAIVHRISSPTSFSRSIYAQIRGMDTLRAWSSTRYSLRKPRIRWAGTPVQTGPLSSV